MMKFWIMVLFLETVCSSNTTMTPPKKQEADCMRNLCLTETHLALVLVGCFIATVMVYMLVCKQCT